MFRSKARWIEKGEKPTNYFFNLEKRNFEKRVIAQLKLENGEIISDMKQINQEIELFYSDLLETKSSGFLSTNFRENFFAFVEDLDIPKLSLEESVSLESDLTLGEIKNVLTSFQNNKSPGEDGFSKEFYETFFDLIGTHLLNSYNEAFTKGQLSISQRRGVICLIPKEDSSLIELSNWRPLTLLNVDYKILAKAIGQRIESILSSIIHSDQTGFIKGRFIGQNVRLSMISWSIQRLKNSQASYFLLIFVKHSTPLNGISSTSVLNYTTLAQILQNGYPFFIIMWKVA